MHYFRSVGSFAFCLAILIFSFSAINAQDFTSNNKNSDSEKSAKTASEASSNTALKLSEKPSAKKSHDNTQDTAVEDRRTFKRPHWGVYGGSFTFHRDLSGPSAEAQFGLAAIRYATVINNNPNIKVRYIIDFVPVALINYRRQRLVQDTPTTTRVISDRKLVYGVGYNPFGIQVNFRNRQKVQPFIAGGAGFFVFTKKVPDNRTPLQPRNYGSQFQLTADFGGGVEIPYGENRSFFVGYKYHHMSNAYTAPRNVGINTNMVYAGIYFGR